MSNLRTEIDKQHLKRCMDMILADPDINSLRSYIGVIHSNSKVSIQVNKITTEATIKLPRSAQILINKAEGFIDDRTKVILNSFGISEGSWIKSQQCKNNTDEK